MQDKPHTKGEVYPFIGGVLVLPPHTPPTPQYRDGYIYSEDDIRYALPEHLYDIGKVERAIELAKDDLVNKYGLPDPDTLIFDESEVATEDCVGQMTLLDLLSEELPKAA